jgi:putative tricarboxylic transport membrane protein
MSERGPPEKGRSRAAEGGGHVMPPGAEEARTDGPHSPKQPGFRFFIRSPRDFWGGLALIGLAILAIWASHGLPGQRGFAFGPGTAPRLFAGLLAGLGAAVALVGILDYGPPIERYKLRGPALVIVAILIFAAMIRPLGLVPATFLAFVISILGTAEMRWIESLIAAAAMTLFCVLLFVYLLGLPFQLWPRFD